MIKKQKKWIALLTALTFMWLLQVSTMPLAAANTTEQVGSASAEQGPDFVEAAGHKVAPAPKKSILPYVLIGVGVVAVAAVLILVVFKTTYDIVGTWTNTDTILTHTTDIVFKGDKKSGTLTLIHYIDTGTYTVSGKTVHFEFRAIGGVNYNFVFDGQFDTKDKMSGTVKYYYNNAVDRTGTWSAIRIATSTETGKLPMTDRPAGELK
jgi:hypothetical protein